MALAETANLLVKLTLEDNATGTVSKVKTSLSDMGKVALGVAGAAGFGALTKGALDAEAAQGKFMAATGKSREEAKQFVTQMDGLAGSAGTVGMKFEDLAALGTTVEQQFGTTGQKTQDLTENIAEFARVTGTDANTAAGDLEDTLSAYGLSADDARGFMDELVASNQKFGTEVGPEALGVLQNMAPAIQTLGGNADDAVGFLNLMETAGLDASGAVRGLNTAAANAPDGTTMQGIYDHLASIQDQGDRTKEAVRLFGIAAGEKLALAIQPGQGSLDDFKVSAEEAAGKTGKAAEDMLTLSDRIKGFAEKAMAGARELGQDFGPAITGLASLGSLAAPFANGFKDMFAKVLAQVLPTATAAGVSIGEAEAAGTTAPSVLQKFTGAGGTLGNALGVAIGVGVGVVLADQMIQAINSAKQQIESNPDSIDGPDLFDARAPMWARAKVQAAAGMQEVGQSALDAFNTTWDAGIANGMSPSDPALLAAAKAAGEAAGNQAGTSTTQTYQESLAAHIQSERDEFVAAATPAATALGDSPAWGDAGEAGAHGILDDFLNLWDEHKDDFKDAAAAATDAFSQKVLDDRGTAQSAWQDYVDMMKHPLDTAAEIAELKGDLASKKLRKGLESNDPQTRQWAENTRDAIQARIDDLEKLLGQDGTDAGDAFTNHLTTAGAKAIAEAQHIQERVNAWLNEIKSNIKINIDVDTTGQGPTAHGHRAGGGPVKKGVAYIVGERRPELFVPKMDGTIIPEVPPSAIPKPWGAPGGVASIPPIQLNASLAISAREATTQIAHYQVLAGGRLPVSRV